MRFTHFVLGATLLMLGGCARPPEVPKHRSDCPPGGVYSMQRAQCIDNTTLLQMLEPYPVVFIGDLHDNLELHRFVAGLIDALHGAGYRVHLANEWFTPADDALLEEYAAGGIKDADFVEKIGWKEKAGYDFELFSPIYHAVQRDGGGLYGINLDREFRQKISDANVTAMTPEERRFYEGLDMNVSAHRQMLAPYLDHCAHAANRSMCSERMYRVQVAWDAMMARESARLVRKVLTDEKQKLLVFAGAFHFAYGLGINMRFARELNLPPMTLLPVARNLAEGYPVGAAELLYLYDAEAAEGRVIQ